MKKLINLILILALFVPTVPVFSEAEDVSDTEWLRKERVSVSLGLVDDNTSSQEFVTRADLAKSVLALLNEPVGKVTASTFTDIDIKKENHRASERMKVLGLMVGTGDNKFSPDGNVDFKTAVRVILKATNSVQMVGDKEIVSSKNYDLLTKGMSRVPDNEILKYEHLASLMYNALDMLILEYSITGGGSWTSTSPTGDTVLSKYHNMEKHEGVLWSDMYQTIKSEARSGEIGIRVGERSFKTEESYDSLLGMSVECYADIDTKEVKALTYSKDNEVIVIEDKDIENYSDRTYTYKNESGSLRKEKISHDVDIQYNGVVMTGYSDEKMNPKDGYVMLIDNNKDGKTDVVRVMAYTNIVVSGASTKNGITTIYDKTGDTIVYIHSEDLSLKTFIEDSEGNEAQVKSIKDGTVVSVIGTKDEAQKALTAVIAVISTSTVTGSITSVDEDGRVIINDNEYRSSASFNRGSVNMNQEYTFYIDYRGKIAGVGGVERSDIPMAIGYLIKTGIDEEGYCFARILTPYNKVITYFCAERVRMINAKDDQGVPTDMRFDEHEGIKSQLENADPVIGYTVDEEKRIDKIMLSVDATGGPGKVSEKFGIYNTVRSGDTKFKYYPYFESFYGRVNMNKNTIMFVVPIPTEEDPNPSTDKYKVEKPQNLPGGDNVSYQVEGYTFDNSSLTSDVVVVHANVGTSIKDDSRIAVVKKLIKTIDPDEDPAYKLTLLSKEGESELYTKEDAVISRCDVYNDKNAVKTVHSGDVILYATDNDGKVSKITIVYDAKEEKFYSTDAIGDSKIESISRRIMMGKAYDKDDQYIQLLNTEIEEREASWDKLEALPMERAAVVICEKLPDGRQNVRLGGLADVKTYKENGKGAKVIINSLAYIAYMLVVIE